MSTENLVIKIRHGELIKIVNWELFNKKGWTIVDMSYTGYDVIVIRNGIVHSNKIYKNTNIENIIRQTLTIDDIKWISKYGLTINT